MEETVLDLSKLEEKYNFTRLLSIDNSLDESNYELLEQCLFKSSGVENVQGVLIEYDAELEDCSILKYFPNINSVVLLGKNLKSLAGIHDLSKLTHLSINIKRKKTFDFSHLENISLETLRINDVKKNEEKIFESLGNVNNLHINGCNITDFSILKDNNIDELTISKGKFEKIIGVEDLELSKLELYACRNVTCIESKNKFNLKSLWITGCNKLNLSSIKENLSTKSFRLMSRTQEFHIDNILQIEDLEEFICTALQAETNINSLVTYNKKLKTVYLAPFPKKTLQELNVKFPGIEWTT